MPISVACSCGRGFTLKDELAGRTLSCPGCGSPIDVPVPPAAWIGATLLVVGIVVTVAAAVTVGVALSAKRHVSFYRDGSRAERLMAVLQDSRFQPITATYTVVDATGAPMARLSKNIFTNILRRRWRCTAPDGVPICVAVEDSIILALLRRFMGPMLGLLRTNYLLVAGESADGPVLGEFNRKLTLFDRYVLDMTGDPGRSLDRRLTMAGLYAAAGVAGGLASAAVEPAPTAGASGAIFGLMGGLVAALQRARRSVHVRDHRIGFVIAVWAMWQLALGFMSPFVANFAHLGGFVAGGLLACVVPLQITVRGRPTPCAASPTAMLQ